MDYGGELPAFGLIIGGVLLPGWALLLIPVAIVILAALAIRAGFRSGQTATQA